MPRFRVALVVLASICLVFAIVVPLVRTAFRVTPTISIVVPNGFRGVLTIEEADGAPGPEMGENSFTYMVSGSGTCRTSALTPFRQWHKLRGRYADGSYLPVYGLGSSDPTRVFLYELGGGSNDVLYLVGTKAEYDRLHKGNK